MAIVERIREDLKVAMRAKDQARLGTLRLLLSSIQEEGGTKRQRALDQAVQKAGVELRLIPESELPPEEPLTEDEIEQVVRRELKKRQDAQETYSKAGRAELAASEEAASDALRVYLPQQLDASAARPHVAAIIEEMAGGEPMGPADMKRVMPVVMEQMRGKAEGRVLNQLVRELLSN
jgi:uncharacterized protein YqeY